jgi:hypothetical protein
MNTKYKYFYYQHCATIEILSYNLVLLYITLIVHVAILIIRRLDMEIVVPIRFHWLLLYDMTVC